MNETFYHLAAFFGSVAATTNNAAIAGVPDSILTRNAAGEFILPQPCQILGMAGGGVNCSRQRINTPSLRYVGLPSLGPINNALTINSPPNVSDYGLNAPTVPKADGLSVESSNSAGAPENHFSLMWLSPAIRLPQPGPRYRLRGTGAITNSAGTWQNGTLTLDQTLPAGTYMVCGMDVIGTNLLAGRLIFANGGWRPGVLARNAVGSVPSQVFAETRFGALGIFDSVNTPNLETISSGANTSQEVYLDVVRIGGR